MYYLPQQLNNIRRDEAERYSRICERLKTLQGFYQPVTLLPCNVGKLLAVDKTTSNIFAALQLSDGGNRHFWSGLAFAWKKSGSQESFEEAESAKVSIKQTPDFTLVKQLLTSEDPTNMFGKLCLYNRPHKLLRALLQNQNPRVVLYALRRKYRLSMPESFKLKTEPNLDGHKRFQTIKRATILLEASLGSTDQSSQHHLVENDSNEPENSLLEEERLPKVAEIDDKITRRTRRSVVEALIIPETKQSLDAAKDNASSSVADSDEAAVKVAKDRLERLRVIFEESDLDDEPGLDIDEFKLAMRRISGNAITEREIALIFMKVDANCDGNVDWNEFLEYTLREYQERDTMSRMEREMFFNGGAEIKYRGTQELRVVLWAPSAAVSSSETMDWHAGRYYSITTEGLAQCWTADFEKYGSGILLIPGFKSVNCHERVADAVCIPEIRAILCGFTTGILRFYAYDDAKLDNFCTIYGLIAPPVCMSYSYRENLGILFFADQTGKIQAVRFKNLFYDGFWSSLGVSVRTNGIVSWADLKNIGNCLEVADMESNSLTLQQVQFYPEINTLYQGMDLDKKDDILSQCHSQLDEQIMACSNDPVHSLTFIAIQESRPSLHVSNQKGGFNCFDYNHDMHLIATGSSDRCLKIWQPAQLKIPMLNFPNHGGSVDKVMLLSARKLTVAVSADSFRTLRVFDIREQTALQEIPCPVADLRRSYINIMLYNEAAEVLVYGAEEILILRKKPMNMVDEGQSSIVRSHKNHVVAALYNDLFDSVVSGCQGSTIIVWNIQNGEKIIHFPNAHFRDSGTGQEPIPIRDMTFDSMKRRLLTLGEEGIIKLWNFNNGACLTQFAQLEDQNLNVVRYQKNRDLLITAGFNRKICMFRDTRGEDDVEEAEYEWDPIHRSDVTVLETIYENNVNYSISPEESNRPSGTVEGSSQKRPLTRTGSSTDVPTLLQNLTSSTSVADSRRSEHSDAESADSKLLDDHSVIISGSFDGEVIVWNCFTGAPACFLNTDGSTKALVQDERNLIVSHCTHGSPQGLPTEDLSMNDLFSAHSRKPKHVKKTDARSSSFEGEPSGETEETNPTPQIPKIVAASVDSISCMVVLGRRERCDTVVATIIAAAADGFIRAWSPLVDAGGLRAVFNAGNNVDSYVRSMCADPDEELLFTADNKGYVKIWFLCDWANGTVPCEHKHKFDPRPFPAIRRHKVFAYLIAVQTNKIKSQSLPRLDLRQQGFYSSPRLLNSFRAHLSAINHLSIIPKRQVIITSSHDCSIRIWTFAGLYVGTLGQTEPFHIDISEDLPSVPQYDFRAKSQAAILREDIDDILTDYGTAADIILKPRTAIPGDIEAKGSSITLDVIKNRERTSWRAHTSQGLASEKLSGQINGLEYAEIENEKVDIGPTIFATPNIRKAARNPRDRQKSPVETVCNEVSIYQNVLEKPMEKIENLLQVLPDCVYDYNINKIQGQLIQNIPAWRRPEFLALQKEGRLAGEPMRRLVAIAARKDEAILPKPTNINQIHETKKVDLAHVRTTIEKHGASARKTLVDYLLEPKNTAFVQDLLTIKAVSSELSSDTIFSPTGPSAQARHLQSIVESARRKRQTRTSVRIVEGNMDTLTTLRTMEKAATQKKRPPQVLQLAIMPSPEASRAVQRIFNVDDVDKNSLTYKNLLRITETVSPRKLPKVPRLRRKQILQDVPKKTSHDLKKVDFTQFFETFTKKNVLRRSVAKVQQIITRLDAPARKMEVDDYVPSAADNGKTASIIEAERNMAELPTLPIQSYHPAPTSPAKYRSKLFSVVSDGKPEAQDIKTATEAKAALESSAGFRTVTQLSIEEELESFREFFLNTAKSFPDVLVTEDLMSAI